MFSTIASIFASKKDREAEALAKLKEEREARRKRADYRNNSSDNTIDTTTMSAAYCMSQYEPTASTQQSDDTLSEGSGSFSGAGASSSWSSSSSDSSSSCSSSD
jgi:hypothetical protein